MKLDAEYPWDECIVYDSLLDTYHPLTQHLPNVYYGAVRVL